MDKSKKQITQLIDEETPLYEAYTIIKVQDSFVFRTVLMRGETAIGVVDSQPYWHIEAKNKFKVAAGKLFQEVLKDRGSK